MTVSTAGGGGGGGSGAGGGGLASLRGWGTRSSREKEKALRPDAAEEVWSEPTSVAEAAPMASTSSRDTDAPSQDVPVLVFKITPFFRPLS